MNPVDMKEPAMFYVIDTMVSATKALVSGPHEWNCADDLIVVRRAEMLAAWSPA